MSPSARRIGGVRELMNQSIAASSAEAPQQKLSGIHGSPVKANLHPKEPEGFLREIAKDTIKTVGKIETAAEEIDISAARLSAKLTDGSVTLKQLEALGIPYAVRWAEEILRQLGPLSTPQARMREQIRAIRRAADELEQGLEHIA